MKDTVAVTTVPHNRGGSDLELDGNELIILRGTHHTEGEYQCATVIEKIPLTENTTINTRLISSAVRLRRARITRFEPFNSPVVRVRQGQVARLPCLGQPDVIPGPPDVWMEREGHEGVPLGMTSNLRFVSTPSGMQVAIAQPSDAGNYYCVVRNTHTNQTRKAAAPIILQVDSKLNFTQSQTRDPLVIYPKMDDYTKPFVVHAVAGQRVVLECVIWHARVVWHKSDNTMPPVTITDETARIRQIWGNLRIKHVNVNDSGIYECHGLDRFDDYMTIQEPKHPRLLFQLVVHAPTDVNLMVAQSLYSKSMQLSCYNEHINYEMPMVYINGDALIDAMEKFGIAPQTNFFTNPVNVTLSTSKPLTGSIQCISKPAGSEAEIYGDGLERGRSRNLYVTDRSSSVEKLIEQGPTNVTRTVGSDVHLSCVAASSDVKIKWLKNNQRIDKSANPRISIIGSSTLLISQVESADQGWYTCIGTAPSGKSLSRISAFVEVINITIPTSNNVPSPIMRMVPTFEEPPAGPLVIFKPRGFVASGQNVRLQWALPANHPQLANLKSFDVELRKTTDPSQNWLNAGVAVQPHVRAVTVRTLVPKNKYQFRIVGNLENKTKIVSPQTDWMEITEQVDLLPQPKFVTVDPLSHNSIQLSWQYASGMQITEEDKFHINYQSINTSIDDHDSFVVTGVNHVIIQNLEPNTHYAFSIYAVNSVTRSPVSKIELARTFPEGWIQDGEFENRKKLTLWRSFKKYLNSGYQAIAIVILSAIIITFLICTLCIFIFKLYSKLRKRFAKEKDYEPQKSNIRYCVESVKTKKSDYTVSASDPSESSPLNSDPDHERWPFYFDRSPDAFSNDHKMEMHSTPIRRPRLVSGDYGDNSSPSRISLDTVVATRTESTLKLRDSQPGDTLTRPKKNGMTCYMNVGSETNVYSTFRRSGSNRRPLPPTPSLSRRGVDSDSTMLLDGTNQAYSPESSTISPISNSSLNCQPPPEPARTYHKMSTFRPSNDDAYSNTLRPATSNSQLTYDRRQRWDSSSDADIGQPLEAS
uniref:Receptor protein-tyrosine kinase n=1 Tax=Panagrellus redivivus TaxID=6233 RepID=A0A7E4URY6_PANRE